MRPDIRKVGSEVVPGIARQSRCAGRVGAVARELGHVRPAPSTANAVSGILRDPPRNLSTGPLPFSGRSMLDRARPSRRQCVRRLIASVNHVAFLMESGDARRPTWLEDPHAPKFVRARDLPLDASLLFAGLPFHHSACIQFQLDAANARGQTAQPRARSRKIRQPLIEAAPGFSAIERPVHAAGTWPPSPLRSRAAKRPDRAACR